MRLFNGTLDNTSKGVKNFDSERLYFGSQAVEFHRSLYTTRGATFGNSLMFGTLVCDLDKVYRLHGCTIDSHQISGLEALVVLALPLQEDGKITVPESVFGAKVLLAHETAVVFRDEPEIRRFHALVVLKAGSSVELTETYSLSGSRLSASAPAPLAKRRRRKATAQPAAQAKVQATAQPSSATKVTRVAFDGDKVTIAAV